MTKEETAAFEKELLETVHGMQGTIHDPPRFVLTGELIPEALLKEDMDPDADERRSR